MKFGLTDHLSVSSSRSCSYNILMLAPTGFFSDYGCHVRILEEAAILQNRGHRPLICTYHRGRDLPWLNIVRIPHVWWGDSYAMGSSWHKLTFDVLLFIRAVLSSFEKPPDLIHAFLHEGAWIGHILSRLWNVPLVFDYQGSLTGEMVDHKFLRPGSHIHQLFRFLENRIDRLPHAIVTSSTHASRLLKKSLARSHPAIFTIPDSVDSNRFRPISADSVQNLREKVGLPNSKQVITYLGKLADYQGTGLLLRAAAQICGHRDDVHFLIMGYPDVEKYRAEARQLGIADKVTFTGRIPYEKAAQYLSLADIAVAPKISKTESNGKLLNYMAMGLPTVAFDSPVAREYLGVWGQYAAGQNVDSLAAAMENLLSQKTKRHYLGNRLRERATQLYSWDQAGERIERIYQLVLDKFTSNDSVPSCSRKVKA